MLSLFSFSSTESVNEKDMKRLALRSAGEIVRSALRSAPGVRLLHVTSAARSSAFYFGASGASEWDVSWGSDDDAHAAILTNSSAATDGEDHGASHNTVGTAANAPPSREGSRAFDEEQLRHVGRRFIIGTDEAGRGPIYGPVVAAACWVVPHLRSDLSRPLDDNALSRRASATAELSAPAAAKRAQKRKAPAAAVTVVQPPRVGDSKKLTQRHREQMFHLLTGFGSMSEFFAAYSTSRVASLAEGASEKLTTAAPAGSSSRCFRAWGAGAAAAPVDLSSTTLQQLLLVEQPWLAAFGGSTSLARSAGDAAPAVPDVFWTIAMASPAYIDKHNILASSLACMAAACRGTAQLHPGIAGRELLCLVDGNQLPPAASWPPHSLCAAVVKGDDKSFSIGAASILAKVGRDHLMQHLGTNVHPGYGIETHQGYPTSTHLTQLHKLGVTPLHRVSYAPCRKVMEAAERRRKCGDGSVSVRAKAKPAPNAKRAAKSK